MIDKLPEENPGIEMVDDDRLHESCARICEVMEEHLDNNQDAYSSMALLAIAARFYSSGGFNKEEFMHNCRTIWDWYQDQG